MKKKNHSHTTKSHAYVCHVNLHGRANVCENREQLGKPKKRARCKYRKIKGKLYIIKVYRKPLKKHIPRVFFLLLSCVRCRSIEMKKKTK